MAALALNISMDDGMKLMIQLSDNLGDRSLVYPLLFRILWKIIDYPTRGTHQQLSLDRHRRPHFTVELNGRLLPTQYIR
jgi:hypothetical protein